eukprot:1379325-Amorphochlora_amoeboformis.AAC.1
MVKRQSGGERERESTGRRGIRDVDIEMGRVKERGENKYQRKTTVEFRASGPALHVRYVALICSEDREKKERFRTQVMENDALLA